MQRQSQPHHAKVTVRSRTPGESPLEGARTARTYGKLLLVTRNFQTTSGETRQATAPLGAVRIVVG